MTPQDYDSLSLKEKHQLAVFQQWVVNKVYRRLRVARDKQELSIGEENENSDN